MAIDETPTSALLGDIRTLSAILATEVNPTNDLGPHPPNGPSDSDSFYVLSYLKAKNRKFTLLFHLIILNKPSPPGPVSLMAISVLDETAIPKYHYAQEVADRGLEHTEISTAGLGIRFVSADGARSLGHLSGTMDRLIVEGCAIDEGGRPRVDFGLTLEARGPTFPYLGSGVIPFPGGLNYEYAFPAMDCCGRLTVEEEVYDVKGTSWFEREWGHVGPAKWTWININLTSGVRLAVWDQQKFGTGSNSRVGGQAFATILDPNGHVTAARARIEECSFWDSADRKQRYADSWRVTIPGKSTLMVETLLAGQEVKSMIPRIEAKCQAKGTYDDKEVEGEAFAETGDIPDFQPPNK